MNSKNITISGAGMAGCLMAILLAKDGFAVEIYESGSDITKLPTVSKRSINQSLGAKGVSALQQAGLWETVKQIALPQTGRLIHQKSGDELYEPYGQKQDFIEWTINRNELNKLLLSEIKKYSSIHVTFDVEVIDIDLKKRELVLKDKNSARRMRKKSDLIIGADGINSQVRLALESAGETTAWIDEMSWGYKNILLKESGSQTLPFRNDAFHCWPAQKSSMVGMMNREFFTSTLILPLRGEDSFESLNTKKALSEFFRIYYPDFSKYVNEFADDFTRAKPTVFRTLHTSKWYYKDFVILIGDAAHAMTIFYGQGVNSAFDDCVTLAKLIKKHPTDFETAFRHFQAVRRRNTEVIAALCLDRLDALKSKYSSPYFLAKTRLEMKLEKLLPNLWLSEYTLMVHTALPYADGLKRYQKQRRIARLLGMDIATLLYGSYLSLQEKPIHTSRFVKRILAKL